MANTSEKLKNIRTAKKITQKQLADMANISEISIRKYESGERIPKIETLSKLANALGVSVNELVSDSSIIIKEISDYMEKYMLSLEEILNDETDLLNSYRLLNKNGKHEAKKRINELSQLDMYKA